MRDDIHKKLPLPRAWKRLVRHATNDAERRYWTQCARQVWAFEIEQISPPLLTAAARWMEQPDLFERVDPRLRELAVTPIDHEFIRQLAVERERDAKAAQAAALAAAAKARVAAQLLSVRQHTAMRSPKDAEPLRNRLATVLGSPDKELIVRAIEGRRPVARPDALPKALDFEMDMRSGL